MYERFTDRARKVMQLANQEAQRLNHEYIGTEHILLGIIKEGSGVGANVLKNLDIDLPRTRREIEKIAEPNPEAPRPGKLPQTPRAKKAIEYAIEEARVLNHNYVGTEHLLLGLLREEEGIAAQVLVSLGLKLADVREEVLHLVGQAAEPSASTVRERRAKLRLPLLDIFGQDLTQAAYLGTLTPVIGRQAEIERLIQVLCRQTTNCPLLVGEPGVGKSAILSALAQRIAAGEVPEPLRDQHIFSIDLKSVLAASYKAKAPNNIRAIALEVQKAKNILLTLAEVPALIDPQLLDEADYGRSLFRLALIRREIRCLAALTPGQHESLCKTDIALARSFQPIHVQPATPAEARDVLHGLRERFGAFHRVHIEDDALQAAVLSAERLFRDSCLPGSAVEILDEACALVQMRALTRPAALREFDAQIERLNQEKEELVGAQEFPKAAALRDQVERLQQQKEQALHDWRERARLGTVTADVVAEAAGRITALPGTQPH
jgi:ATP-dependent Clp protease ATP-binding subunit ClpC